MNVDLIYLLISLSNDSRSSTESRNELREKPLAGVAAIAGPRRGGPSCGPCPTYKLPATLESVETDASGHAGQAEESFREMHLAEAPPATASSDSNIVLDDALSRDLVVVARLLPPPADLCGRSSCESVALMVAVINVALSVQLVRIAVRWQMKSEALLPGIHQYGVEAGSGVEMRRGTREAVGGLSDSQQLVRTRLSSRPVEASCQHQKRVAKVRLNKEANANCPPMGQTRVGGGLSGRLAVTGASTKSARSELPSCRVTSSGVRGCPREGEVERALGAREGVVAASGDPVKHASAQFVAGSGNAAFVDSKPVVSRKAHTLLGMGLPPFAPRGILDLVRAADSAAGSEGGRARSTREGGRGCYY